MINNLDELRLALERKEEFCRLITNSKDLMEAMRKFPEDENALIQQVLTDPDEYHRIFSFHIFMQVIKEFSNLSEVIIQQVLTDPDEYLKIINQEYKLRELCQYFPNHADQLIQRVLLDVEKYEIFFSAKEVLDFGKAFPKHADKLIKNIIADPEVYERLIGTGSELTGSVLAELGRTFPDSADILIQRFIELIKDPKEYRRRIKTAKDLADLVKTFPKHADALINRLIGNSEECKRLIKTAKTTHDVTFIKAVFHGKTQESILQSKIEDTDSLHSSLKELVSIGRYVWRQADVEKLMRLKVHIMQATQKYGTELNRPDNRGRTPLMLAVESGYEDIVKHLLLYNANPNARTDSTSPSPLTIAVSMRNLAIAKILLNGGAEKLKTEHELGKVSDLLANNGMLIEFFDERLLTAEMYEIAVRQDGRALQFVPEKMQTKTMCEHAAAHHSNAIKFVKNEELRLSLLERFKNKTETEDQYDVVISGMGPTGLAVALEAIKAGKSVLIISDRKKDFVRVQRVLVNQDSIEYLAGLSDDEDSVLLTKKLAMRNIAIKDTERYLFKQIEKLQERGECIDLVFESELTKANLQDGVAFISSKNVGEEVETKMVRFDYLVGADGRRRHALKVLKDQVPEIQEIEQRSKYIPHHATVYLTVKMKDGQPFNFPVAAPNIIYSEGLHTGIFFDLESNHKSEHKSIKCSFTCEIPKVMREIPDSEEQKAAFLVLVREKMQETFKEHLGLSDNIEVAVVKYSKVHGHYKDKTKYGMFSTKDVELSQAAAERNGRFYVSAGDVVSDPDYRSGSGLNNGLRHANQFGRLLRGEIDVLQYNKYCRETSTIVRETLAGNRLQIYKESSEDDNVQDEKSNLDAQRSGKSL